MARTRTSLIKKEVPLEYPLYPTSNYVSSPHPMGARESVLVEALGRPSFACQSKIEVTGPSHIETLALLRMIPFCHILLIKSQSDQEMATGGK